MLIYQEARPSFIVRRVKRFRTGKCPYTEPHTQRAYAKKVKNDVREIWVYDGNVVIGRIIELTCNTRPKWGLKNDDRYAVQMNSKYGFCNISPDSSNHEVIGYAPTVIQAKQIAEKKMLETWAAIVERDAERQEAPTRKLLNPAELTYGDNEDFYPTPLAVAGRMLAHVVWRETRTEGKHDTKIVDVVETILEPSAGKGDLLDALLMFADRHQYDFGWHSTASNPMWGRSPEKTRELVDVIESDPNLQNILKGKGYRVVDDDFLTFRSHRKYDLILMNPPFSEGDRHLMKAISLVQPYGGQIVCLLNAQTIRNPYTELRGTLLQQLSKYKAKFEYIKGGFRKAERRTDVEVVIVSVRIPAPPARSHILEHLKKAPEYTGENEPTALAVKGDWIHGLIQEYNFEADFGVRLLREYQGYVDYVSPNATKYNNGALIEVAIGGSKTAFVNTETINNYLRSLRLKFWNKLMRHPKLEETVGKLTSAMYNEYTAKIDSMKDYEFSEYNIRALILDMMGQLNQGMKDAIIGLFETLSSQFSWYPASENNRHYYNGWATNKAHKVGMRAIVPMNGFAAEYSSKTLDTYHIHHELSDLERVMDFLDRGETAFHYNLQLRVDEAEATGSTTVETTYFTAKFYKKRTCHITFRPEAQHIVDRLNIFASMNKGWLPPYYGKVRYEDMDEEGKAAVDSFHAATCPSGKKADTYQLPAYSEVCKNPNKFLTTVDGGSSLLMLGA